MAKDLFGNTEDDELLDILANSKSAAETARKVKRLLDARGVSSIEELEEKRKKDAVREAFLLEKFPEDSSGGGRFTKGRLEEQLTINSNLGQLRGALPRMMGKSFSTAKKADMIVAFAKGLLDRKKLAHYMASYSENEFNFLCDLIFPWGRDVYDSMQANSIDLANYASKDSYWSSSFDNAKLPFASIIVYDTRYAGTAVSIQPVILEYMRYMLSAFSERYKLLESEESKNFKEGYAQNGDLFAKSPVILAALMNAGLAKRSAGDKVLKSMKKALHTNAVSLPFATAERLKDSGYDVKSQERLLEAADELYIAFFAAAFAKEQGGQPSFASAPKVPLELYRTAVDSFLSSGNTDFDLAFLVPGIKPDNFYGSQEWLSGQRVRRMEAFRKLLTAWAKGNLDGQKGPDWNTSLDIQLLVENLPRLEGLSFDEIKMRNLLYAYYEDSYSNKHWTSFSGSYEFIKYLYLPFYSNLFLTFAALGLFEVSWEPLPRHGDFKDMDDSGVKGGHNYKAERMLGRYKTMKTYYPYGRVKAVRMTELGRTVFDKDRAYGGEQSTLNPPVLKSSFVISMDKGDAVSAEILKPYGHQRSPTLFKTGLREILAVCKDREELDAFFTSLKAMCGKGLPQEWQELQKEAERRFVRLKPDSGYVVFNLEGQGRELLAAVESICAESSDIRRMEGRMLAVPRDKLESFYAELEERSFVVTG